MNRWLLSSIVLTVLAAVSVGVVYVNREAWLPEQIPTHWGLEGKPDAWTPREEVLPYLLIPPGTMALMVLMTLALPWLSPKSFSIESFRSTYDYLMAVVVFLFAYIHCVLLIAQVSEKFDLVKWLVSGMMLILAALGNVLGKVKRNFYVGVKTPWTLASDVVWNRTHRLAAWLMTVGGLVGGIAVLCGLHPFAALVVFVGAVVYPVFYSLWLYKKLEREGQLDLAESAPLGK